MERLNVFATDEETERAKELATRANSTPVIGVTSAHAMRGGFAADAWQSVYDFIASIARTHDLPEISGRYGLDLATGEFLQ